jgi:5'-nucleotidase
MDVKKNERLILVTNDDGVNALGIKMLTEVMKPFGELLVIAPERPRSGMSHAITIEVPLRTEKISEYDNVTVYSCTGTPVDCVKLAMDKLVDRKPDLIVSGINHGSNASINVIYSATMAAAIEGSMNNIPSVGFSLLSHSRKPDFEASKIYVEKIIKRVLDNGIPNDVCLNVNIPLGKPDEIKGIKICRQTKGVWVEEFDKRVDPQKQDYYWLTGSFINHENYAEGTDEWALKNKYISVVPIHTDLTCYSMIDKLKDWDKMD